MANGCATTDAATSTRANGLRRTDRPVSTASSAGQKSWTLIIASLVALAWPTTVPKPMPSAGQTSSDERQPVTRAHAMSTTMGTAPKLSPKTSRAPSHPR